MLKTTAGAELYCCAPYKLRLAAQAIMRPHSAWWCSGAVQPLKMEMEIAAQPTLSPFPVQHCAATLQSGRSATLQSGRLLHGYSAVLLSEVCWYVVSCLHIGCCLSHVTCAVCCILRLLRSDGLHNCADYVQQPAEDDLATPTDDVAHKVPGGHSVVPHNIPRTSYNRPHSPFARKLAAKRSYVCIRAARTEC